MNARRKPFSVATLFAGVGVTFACNGVLGIEPAELDPGEETGVLTCNYEQDDPTRSCLTGTACETCLEREAPGVTAACITASAEGLAKSCRAALVEYRLCIGDNCADENGKCAGCLSGSPLANQLAAAVRACPDCQTSSIAETCEVYCACMGEKCPTTPLTSCYQTCQELAPYKQYCRWQHCERATDAASPHCSHAIGGEGACNEESVPGGVCNGIWDGLGCDPNNPDECCHKTCREGICTPN
jgi:hypothetical protein